MNTIKEIENVVNNPPFDNFAFALSNEGKGVLLTKEPETTLENPIAIEISGVTF
jgi:lipid-binding SYLF domain-containing protein